MFGDNCKTLVGKPKLFFIQASRGELIEKSLNPKQTSFKKSNNGDEVNALTDPVFVIPKFADLLVMYSTSKGHYSIRNTNKGSWFIQALCEELKINQQDDLLIILTRVNKRLSFVKQAELNLKVGTQMSNIESTLTKSIFFIPDNSSIMTDDIHYNFSNPKRGIALIFNHETFSDGNKKKGTLKDGKDLKAILEGLNFDVRDYMDLKLEQIKDILYNGKTLEIEVKYFMNLFLISVSKEDHTNNDCLLVTVMTFGQDDDRIHAADKRYNVQELWKNFLGDNCKTLIGKPKLFFIEASRGDLTDPGVIFKPKQATLEKSKNGDEVNVQLRDPMFVTPILADFLFMYGTVEYYHSLINILNGSWFIQTLCE